jgi:hypothetical protein
MTDPNAANLVGPPAEICMTLQITRAATGKVEEVQVKGFTNLTPEQLHELGIPVTVLPPKPQE